MEERLLRIGEVARLAEVSSVTIHEKIRLLGMNPEQTPGGQRRLTKAEAERIIDHIRATRRTAQQILGN